MGRGSWRIRGECTKSRGSKPRVDTRRVLLFILHSGSVNMKGSSRLRQRCCSRNKTVTRKPHSVGGAILKIPAWWSGESVTRGAGRRGKNHTRGLHAGVLRLWRSAVWTAEKGKVRAQGFRAACWPLAGSSFPEPNWDLAGEADWVQQPGTSQGPGPGLELEQRPPCGGSAEAAGHEPPWGPCVCARVWMWSRAQPAPRGFAQSCHSQCWTASSCGDCTSAAFWSRWCCPLAHFAPSRHREKCAKMPLAACS